MPFFSRNSFLTTIFLIISQILLLSCSDSSKEKEYFGCTKDIDCSDIREICVNFMCTIPECKISSDCEKGVCLSGSCMPATCQIDGDCPALLTCINNFCSYSRFSCRVYSCPAPEVCSSDLRCYNPETEDIPCNDHSVCPFGVCIEGGCKSLTCETMFDCPFDSFCENWKCSSIECLYVCDSDKACVNYKCVSNPECLKSQECPETNVCYGGKCEIGCSKSDECPHPSVCIESLCRMKECEDDGECGDGVCKGQLCGRKLGI